MEIGLRIIIYLIKRDIQHQLQRMYFYCVDGYKQGVLFLVQILFVYVFLVVAFFLSKNLPLLIKRAWADDKSKNANETDLVIGGGGLFIRIYNFQFRR